MDILIVDDDDLAIELLAGTLRQRGYTSIAAHNGAEALDILRSKQVRLVLCDWRMPVMDGLEFCRQVREREHEFEGYIYVILVSARDLANSAADGFAAGADDYIMKPYDPLEVCARVRAGERILTLQSSDVALSALARMERTNGQLARRLQELDEFTFTVSHDLQEPLRKLVSFSEILREDLKDGKAESTNRDLEFIEAGARKMQRLIHDLLTLTRLGKEGDELKPTNAEKCVNDALEALGSVTKANLPVITRDRLPMVNASGVLLTQLYQNLIGNALKFNRAKPPMIHLSAERRNDQWVLGVRDNGIGIDSANVERVFAPFRRLQSGPEFEGSGIGLAICRRIAERHGGRIWIESEVGKGSHFRFTIGAVEEKLECRTTATENSKSCSPKTIPVIRNSPAALLSPLPMNQS